MFDDGIAKFYIKVNVASNGMMPQTNIRLVTQEFFENRTIGFNRMFARIGVNIRISKVIRFWINNKITADMICVIEGEQYLIEYVTIVQNEQGLDCMERTLTKTENWYDEVIDDGNAE